MKQLILQSVVAPRLARSAKAGDGFKTDLGEMIVGDCLTVLRGLPENSIDLVVTSPPYDGQPKYGNGEKYERDWYRGFFMQVTREVGRRWLVTELDPKYAVVVPSRFVAGR